MLQKSIEKNIKESVKTPKVASRVAIQPGNICDPLFRWGLRGWAW